MRVEALSPEVLDLARQAGLDLANLSAELSDADLETIVGGGEKLGQLLSQSIRDSVSNWNNTSSGGASSGGGGGDAD